MCYFAIYCKPSALSAVKRKPTEKMFLITLLNGKLADDPRLVVCFNLTSRGSTVPVAGENLHIVCHFLKSPVTEVTMNLQRKRITRQWCHNNEHDY